MVYARAQVLRAPRDLQADEEVLITYGYDGNDHLLLDYGFAEEARRGQLGSEVKIDPNTQGGVPLCPCLSHACLVRAHAYLVCSWLADCVCR